MKKHRIESLNFRDGLMIGDLVYEGSTVHEWEYVDYLRSQKGMEDIKPIPLTEDILKASVIYYTEDFNEEGCHYRKGRVIDINIEPDTMFSSSNVRFVHQLQQLLRALGLTELADNFKIEK